jgi:hypothetical protein
MYDAYPSTLWGPYGFRDAFNLTLNWWGTDYLGIDQGPIILMIENYLNASLWTRFMQNVDVQTGLARAGFVPGTSVDLPGVEGSARLELSEAAPNPFRGAAVVTYRLPEAGSVDFVLYDVAGRPVRTLVRGQQSAGVHTVDVRADGLPSGVYFYRLQSAGETVQRRCVLLR